MCTKRIAAAGLMLALVAAAGQVTPVTAADDKKDGWVVLFNGKDLTGWKTHPEDKGKWEVKDGAIVGTGPVGHLYSEKGDYENFHYRVEAMINEGGNSGQYFRAAYQKGFPKGYEAQINATHKDPVKTGSLYGFKDHLVKEQLHKVDEWFTQEVIANGNHIQIIVNGKKTVDVKVDDPAKQIAKGHFAFQQHHDGSMVKVRKVEVKPLPPTPK